MQCTDYLLAWQMQIREMQKVAHSGGNAEIKGRHIRHNSQGRDLDFRLRPVGGDRDCFFHAVGRKQLTRKKLVKVLKQHAADKEVRRGFAAEIRQFLTIGMTVGHEDPDEHQAYEQVITTEFRRRYHTLENAEEKLRLLMVSVREKFGKISQGKTPEQLLDFLQSQKSPQAREYKNALQAVQKADARLINYCARLEVFNHYVKHYLKSARGFIPFAQGLGGETFRTPIDVISDLFQLNIQVFLEQSGTTRRVTQKRDGEPISILHNGIDHFSGLSVEQTHPIQINEIVQKMPRSDRPASYSMYPNLQGVYLGTHYQILVLLEKASHLMVNAQKFRATFEAKNCGNLDDIIIQEVDQAGITTQVHAYQVKHHRAAIKASAFVNNENGNGTKIAEMHIGKFLDGWLSLLKQDTNLDPDQVESIVYTTAELDPVLAECVSRGRFSNRFISGAKTVRFTGKTNKGQDFYRTLYRQASAYLTTKNLHQDIAFDQSLFNQFLRSFRFRIGQEGIKPLTHSVIENLSHLKHSEVQADQLFLNLFYAIVEWFGHNPIDERTTPELTEKVLHSLLQECQTRFHYRVELQAITQTNLAAISTSCNGLVVKRKERSALEEALHLPGIVMVVGAKGIGKSALVKQILIEHDPAQYIFVPAKDLIENETLKTKCQQILQQKKGPQILVIDSAEALLSLSPDQIQSLLLPLFASARTVALTTTREASAQLPIPYPCQQVCMNPLLPQDMLKHFPQLKPYQHIEALMTLACQPFHLQLILKLMARPTEFAKLLGIDVALEAELLGKVVEGANPAAAEERKEAWMGAAISLIRPANMAKANQMLIDDGILLNSEIVRFSHDLFFEHGLMAFWLTQWKMYRLQNKTRVFWRELPKFLAFNGSASVLAKWYTIHRQNLEPDLLGHLPNLYNLRLQHSLTAMAIVLEDPKLLKMMTPDDIASSKFRAHDDSKVLLAIEMDSPEALEAIFKLTAQKVKTPEIVSTDSSDSDSESESQTDSSEVSASSSSESSQSSSETDSSEEMTSDDVSDCASESDEEEDPIEHFQNLVAYGRVDKYWTTNFYIIDSYFDAEGIWVSHGTYNVPPNNHALAVHKAIVTGSIRCLEVLINHEPDLVHSSNSRSETPLHVSVLRQSLAMTTLLLRADAEVDAEDSWGETPLHNAVYVGDRNLAKLLLEQCADANTISSSKLTPLHLAIARLDLPMVKLLLECDGDLFIKPFSKEHTLADLLDIWSPEHQEQYEKMQEFVIDLIEHLDFGGENKEYEDIVKDLMGLIECRAQINEDLRDWDYYDSESELIYTVENGDEEKIDELIDTILNDPENIEYVLESDAFSDRKIEFVTYWFEQANEAQYQNLRIYAENADDQEILGIIVVSDNED